MKAIKRVRHISATWPTLLLLVIRMVIDVMYEQRIKFCSVLLKGKFKKREAWHNSPLNRLQRTSSRKTTMFWHSSD